MCRKLLPIAVLTLAFVFAASLPAFAAAPPTTPATIVNEGFESSYPSYLSVSRLDITFPSTGWWGPITFLKRTGTRGLWCAGSTGPGSWPAEYPMGSGGTATFDLSSGAQNLADYYSSTLNFAYSMPSLGDDDTNSFDVGWYDASGPAWDGSWHYGPAYFPKTAEGAWNRRSYSLSPAGGFNLSRKGVKVVFQWYDGPEDTVQTHWYGEGVTIDDVSITGYKYGPVRGLQAHRSASSVNLSWQAPVSAVGSSQTDGRTIAYRVWRSLDSAPTNWTELTTTRGTSLSFTDSAAPGGAAHYFVQAWDTGTGTGYGDPSGSSAGVVADPNGDGVAPTTTPVVGLGGLVTLTAADNTPGSGVAGTYYRLGATGTTKTYTGPFLASAAANLSMQCWSVDKAGNAETPKSISYTPKNAAGATLAGSSRYAGTDRYLTGLLADKAGFTRADNVVVASGASWTDALPAAALAGTLRGPLVLVKAASLDTTIAAYLGSLQVKNVYVVGSTTSISANVRSQLNSAVSTRPSVIPVGQNGIDKYGVARDISLALTQASPGVTGRTLFVARSDNFADALAASSIAAAMKGPILLVPTTGTLPGPIGTALADTNLHASRIVVCGSTAAVSDNMANQVSAACGSIGFTRLAGNVGNTYGDNRYGTARALVEWATPQLDPVPDGIYVATGLNFPDALSGGVLAGASYDGRWRPLMTTHSTTLQSTITGYLTAHPTVHFARTLGSDYNPTTKAGAVDDAEVTALKAYLH